MRLRLPNPWPRIRAAIRPAHSTPPTTPSTVHTKAERYSDAPRVLVYKLPRFSTAEIQEIRRGIKNLPEVEAFDIHVFENRTVVSARAKTLEELGPLSVHVEQAIEASAGVKLEVRFTPFRGRVPEPFRIRQSTAA